VLGFLRATLQTEIIPRARMHAGFLSFNGETAGQLTMPYVEKADIEQSLTGLDTIGSVNVVGLLNSAPPVRSVYSDGITGLSLTLDFLVIFGQTGQPPNRGTLPLLKLDLTSATRTNLVESQVSQLCSGKYAAGLTYEEWRWEVTSR
jgi:hypothetical protein